MIKYRRLDEVCSINMGQSPNSESYNYDGIGLPFFQGNADFGDMYPLKRVWCSAPTKIVNENTLLISVRAPIGALNFSNEISCIGRGLAGITPKEEINIKYVYYCLKYKSEELKSKGTGSTFKAISKNALSETKIKIVSIDKQLEIVSVLDHIKQIIKYRKQQLEQLDLLIKSRFVEMFGTPYHNEKGFPLLSVDDVIEFTGGAQPDKKYFEYTPTKDNIRLIQIRDYKTDNYITYIPKAMAKRFCDADDIMIGRYGPPIFQILKGIEGSYNVALMKATPKIGNKEFIRYFLKQDCLFNYLNGLSQRTAGQSGIEMSALKAFPFPYPPIELQDKFAQFVEQVEKSKTQVQKSLDEAQLLFNSLMQKYFG